MFHASFISTGMASNNVSRDRSGKVTMLLKYTGSVASIKIPELCCKLLSTDKLYIRLVPTEKSLPFFAPSSLPLACRCSSTLTIDRRGKRAATLSST
jgi:hypothetical protein